MKLYELIEKNEKSDIVEEIRRKALSYAPEWRFDPDNPDIGTAIALVYAHMFQGTIKRFNKVPLKNCVGFFNAIDTTMLPAIPSSGYVQFKMVNEEVSAAEVPTGTTVSAESDSKEVRTVLFETLDDVFVTPAVLQCIYQSFDRNDTINKLAEAKEGIINEFNMFGDNEDNLQEHELYFSSRMAFNIVSNSTIKLGFLANDYQSVADDFLSVLANPDIVTFMYYSSEGFRTFSLIEYENGQILLRKQESAPKFELYEFEGITDYWIKCVINKIDDLKQLNVSRINFKVSGIQIQPDMVFGNGIECNLKEYFPFGEQLQMYNEVYFGSDEVLSKKGAEISFSFGMDFVKVPLIYNQDDVIQWEWIMKREDFKPNPEYDVTIEEVIWEYYNGNGWSRLFLDNNNSNIFSSEKSTLGQYKSMKFICPEDMTPVLINARETYYIRARIIRLNNMYKTKGYYVTPILSNTVFSYEYKNNALHPDYIAVKNNLELSISDGEEFFKNGAVKLFYSTGYDKKAVYLGFNTSPAGSPIKILFSLRDNIAKKSPILLWQYFDGSKWRGINLVDETSGMQETGMVTMTIGDDIKSKKIFNRDLYWIRICDVNSYYSDKLQNVIFPKILGIYVNTTRISNFEKKETEYFQMEIYQENIMFTLLEKNILRAEVYINEIDTITDRELEKYIDDDNVIIEKDRMGTNTHVWIKWNCVDDFGKSGENDRHYTLNATEGYIQFGNGKRGRIPSPSKEQNIMIQYVSGGGEFTNIDTGNVNKLGRTIGYINEVSNPQILTGGCDMENMEEAITRSSHSIRHQNHAVTLKDYEELALLASRDITKAKCFSGFDENGEAQRGAITMVVLQKNFRKGRQQFGKIKKQVEEYMKDKVCGTIISNKKLFVTEPLFAELNIRVELAVNNFNHVFTVKKEVLERLNKFLNPVEDGNLVWEIGSFPNRVQIQNAISDVKNVIYVRNIFVTVYVNDKFGRREVDMDEIVKKKYILPINGEHDVEVNVI